MHPLMNGTQSTKRPDPKEPSGAAGWFKESGVPSIPGADWFNSNIAEFLNSLEAMGIPFDPSREDHLQRAFQALSLSYFPLDAVSVHDVKEISFDTSIDNRDVIYAQGKPTYVPFGVTIRCNFKPEDDVRALTGEGKVLTRDQWGNERTFDLYKASRGTQFTPSNLLNQGMRNGSSVTVGLLGDSISDGADSTGWTANPTDGNGNLNSTNYDHNKNGGVGAWFRVFIDNINTISGKNSVLGFNASSSGKKLIDGWTNQNFDYGFFQNTAYQNRAPDVLFVAMAVNDNNQIASNEDFLLYLDQYDKIIRKAWGYGSTVGFISLTNTEKTWGYLEGGIKRYIERIYPLVNFYDLAQHLEQFRKSGDETSFSLWYDISNVYDTTHPNDPGHRFLGAAMTKELLGNQIVEAVDSGNLVPQTNNDCLVVGYPSGAKYDILLENVSGGHLSDLEGLAYVTPTNENITCWYFIWCDRNDLSLVFLEPKTNTFTGSGRSHSIKVLVNDLSATENTHKLASAQGDISSYKSSRISRLRYGLNMVRVIYDGQPNKIYLPILTFRRSYDVCTIPQSRRRYANGVQPISLYGASKRLLGRSFQPIDCRDELPDSVDSKAYPYVGYVTVQVANKCGVAVFAKQSANEGLVVLRKDANTVTLKHLDGTILEDVTLDVSDSWSVQWSIDSSGKGQVVVIGSNGSNFTRAYAGLSGGSCLFVNESTTEVTCNVLGGTIQIDT
ncbi:hypothetical protein DR996_02445 [Vibrio owensii]|nr:hypothetical protein DR996_02445 [Vibrio owensii]